MSSEIDNYAKEVESLVSIKEQIDNGGLSIENYYKDDITSFLKTFRTCLAEAIKQADMYLKYDLSKLTSESLNDIKKVFSPWKTWGYSDKNRPIDVVNKVNDELKKRRKES